MIRSRRTLKRVPLYILFIFSVNNIPLLPLQLLLIIILLLLLKELLQTDRIDVVICRSRGTVLVTVALNRYLVYTCLQCSENRAAQFLSS